MDWLDESGEKIDELMGLLCDGMIEKARDPEAFRNIKDLAWTYDVMFEKMVKLRELRQQQFKGVGGGVTIIDDL